MATIPLQPVGNAISVPVRINDSVDSRFILDTGIGLNVISRALSERLKCRLAGSYSGKRMSGQVVKVPLTTVPSLSLGSHREQDVPVGVFDLDDPSLAAAGVEGFLSLAFLEQTPFTIDFTHGVLTLESEPTLEQRLVRGKAVPLRIDRDGPTVGIFLAMDVGVASKAEVEVDTGSEALILDERYLAQLGLTPQDSAVRRVEGTDETGLRFVRYFSRLAGPVHPVGLPDVSRTDVPVMFQKIIYDGLMGNAFLRPFAVTFDLPRARMVFGPP